MHAIDFVTSTLECIATHFDSKNFACTTFTRRQLLIGLSQMLKPPHVSIEPVATVDYVIGKIEYEYKCGNTSVGCPVIQSLSKVQKESNVSLSERSCASICLHGHECDFFHRNYSISTCDFFRKSATVSCTGNANVSHIIDKNTTLLIELNMNLTLAGSPYYEDKHSVAVKSEFAVYNLSIQNTAQGNEEICKGLCDTFPECFATSLVHSLQNAVPSCKLFHAFLLLDENRPITEQETYFVSLERIQNSYDFLSAPNGTCPMFQYNYQNVTSSVMSENQCRSDRSSNGYIWDEKNGQCSLVNMTFFEYCPDPSQGDFMIEYSDFVYFPGGKIPYGSL
jgi:hypothetical protein